jgi:hypothetical protein
MTRVIIVYRGRWHIDSWRPQHKVFLFLNDTTEDSGPFEFILNTNRRGFRLRKALTPGYFFNFRELFRSGVSRPYQSIDDRKIEALIEEGYRAHPIIVKAGTVMIANPSYLIHRARPCTRGKRYALTAYYSIGKNSKDFNVS